ncbi:MAG: hypothetical protein R8M37_02425 [Alphaproteobacteria bacterium]|nr:hypothetical protein [Alphaproteobacteria bacterium]
MPNERENFNGALKIAEYDISGNYLRAYYDADGKLVFVLDFAISDTKPNVLLVINPIGGRKWDDILANDYNVDLEGVRPKKDNKYQKLDVEYTGLGVYDALFRAYDDDKDVDAALKKLGLFRNEASRHAAFERLGTADVMANNARETIEKTKETIKELQERLKNLRTKLSAQRKDVGKEPTKQSASKILRTEAQIDAVNEKTTRAKKRLNSAQRRLIVAEDDADVARSILDLLNRDADSGAGLPMTPTPTDIAVVEDAPVPMAVAPQVTDLTIETKADDMADEEVKPLFDEDPEILDENIAFKPIDFNATSGSMVKNAPVTQEDVEIVSDNVVQPLSFVPPVRASDDVPVVEPAPVLNSLTSVSTSPSEQIDSELMATIDIPGFTDIPDISSESATQEQLQPSVYSEPVTPVAPVSEHIEPTVQEIVEESVPTPMPEIEPAPITSDVRPVSPITGAVSTVGATHRKPTKLYYILLLILIVLSVFTLWFYQKSMPDSETPVLAAQVVVNDDKENGISETVNKEVAEIETKADAPSPFIDTTIVDNAGAESQVATQEVATNELVTDEVAEEPVADVTTTEAEEKAPDDINVDAVVFPDVEPVVVQVAPEPEKDAEEPVLIEEEASDSPFLSDEVVAPAETKSVAEIIALKPVYNVSQQEKMFVADEEYETDAADTVEEAVAVDAPVVDYSEPVVVGVTDVDDVEQEVCSDGNAPDINGCCAGETFVDGLCCADGTDECFEPMN